jgi:hypothetical protein
MQNIFTHDLSTTKHYFGNLKLSVARAAPPNTLALLLVGVTDLQGIKKKYSF